MSFVNPLYFLGALAAAVPVLLHLIKRERARRIEFPTLMFLRRISKKTIRYQRLRHLLLLLLRVLAFVFLALAFTRPYRALPQASAASGRVTEAHIILLDNSLSMGYGDRWERAKKAALDIVRRLRDGDKAALLEFSDRTLIRAPLTEDVTAVTAEIEHGVELTDRPTRYSQALKVAEQLSLDAATGRRVLHLLSDFQKSGWAAEEQEFRFSPGIQLECVDVGSSDYSNLTISNVRVSEVAEDSEGGLRLKSSVINFGTQERKNARVSLAMDGRVVMEQKADLGKGEIREMEFLLPGLTAGFHEVALDVDDAQLRRDNRYSMTMEARGRTQVQAVEDQYSSSGGRPASFFLSRALNIAALSRYQLSTIPLSKAESAGTFTAAILIWNNASGGSSGLQSRLQDFVRNGSGIIIATDGTRASDFNRSFGSWLPVKIENPAAGGGARRGDDYLLLTDLRQNHPIFRPFSSPHSGSFSSARFFRHARLALTAQADVLARFDNGDPALVSVDQDKGRVLIFASSADDSANDLPLKAVYAPLWQQMLRHLDNVSEEKRAAQVGETIAPRKLLLETALRQGKTGIDLNQAIVVLDPARKRVPITPGADSVVVDETGFYEIRTSNLSTSVGVNPVPRESDLAHGNAEEMAAGWVSPETRTTPAGASDEQMTPEDQDRHKRFWRYLLTAAMVCFLGEALFSNQLILKPD